MKANVEVKELSPLNVAYIRHVGKYSEVGNTLQRLLKWAGPRGFLGHPDTKILVVYHDDPDITEEEKLMSSACVTVPPGTKPDGEVGIMPIPGGKFAIARFEISENQFQEAWDAVINKWLPGSGYKPDDRLCYESYLNDPQTHPEKKFIVEIYEPVRPL